ncbi:hypothetical protein Egran_05697 [Elaphomyces granulatus]|uniref:Uncharacterized protein n=1 Tax=Elaphomyces granulatus TaxID=519963 RepID=A0A232LQU4_9EURO|nr:hypothetical protein Egran_05697 [Elaphomyces granulatus]
MAPNLHRISINLCTSQGKGVTLLGIWQAPYASMDMRLSWRRSSGS